MKTTKILRTVALAGLLTTGLYAKGSCSEKGFNDRKGFSKSKMFSKRNTDNNILGIIKKLDLTKDQREEIANIKKDIMKNRVSLDSAFTKKDFDKKKYIDLMEQKRDNMIKSKAEMIDRIHSVLTDKQKEQFKVLLDLQKEKRDSRMERRMNFDKNCNGRR
ncbi:hypothetical protein CP965_12105 [Halarcobacter mediterraneus]|uniref:Uncharacterized protein n=1 Tax=Halarcobacter mediterraneus TaxID=2023153 RepID=A0A4Q1ATW1_9BACT|nr:Spy/CpxP family protein refolding chaperone [Halarcobacter mediterraneus]RXK11917.1 hypothetical protein CP965_12105 [Halarcobacter mediterraneus]